MCARNHLFAIFLRLIFNKKEIKVESNFVEKKIDQSINFQIY